MHGFKGTNPAEPVFVYIIQCKDTFYYTGITNNLLRRWQEHNTKPTWSMRHRKPSEVVYMQPMPNRTTARQLEAYIKQRGAKRYLADRAKHFPVISFVTVIDSARVVTYIH